MNYELHELRGKFSSVGNFPTKISAKLAENSEITQNSDKEPTC